MKGKSIGLMAGGLAATALGAGLMFSQCGTENKTYQHELLNGAASYVEQYQGEKPADALQYVLETIHVAEEGKTQMNLARLEKKVSDIRDEVIYLAGYKQPPTLYPAAMKETAKEIRAVANGNLKNSDVVKLGMWVLIPGLLVTGFGVHSAMKNKKKP